MLLVLGSIAALFAFAALAGGCALVAIDQIQRDDDGFLMSPSEDLSTPTYAIVSESADIDTGGAEWALDTFLGTVRIRSESERPVFVGIARRVEVAGYLYGVERDAVSDFDSTLATTASRVRRPRALRANSRSGSQAPPARGSRRSSGSPRRASGRSRS